MTTTPHDPKKTPAVNTAPVETAPVDTAPVDASEEAGNKIRTDLQALLLNAAHAAKKRQAQGAADGTADAGPAKPSPPPKPH